MATSDFFKIPLWRNCSDRSGRACQFNTLRAWPTFNFQLRTEYGSSTPIGTGNDDRPGPNQRPQLYGRSLSHVERPIRIETRYAVHRGLLAVFLVAIAPVVVSSQAPPASVPPQASLTPSSTTPSE